MDHPPAPTHLGHEGRRVGVTGLGHGVHTGDLRRGLPRLNPNVRSVMALLTSFPIAPRAGRTANTALVTNWNVVEAVRGDGLVSSTPTRRSQAKMCKSTTFGES
jgi:hypothetical protein